MDEIEVEWELTPKSGVTSLELHELGCKNIAQWRKLTPEQQKERLANAISERDLSMVTFIPKEWDK